VYLDNLIGAAGQHVVAAGSALLTSVREEMTLAKIDHHAEAIDELDVRGILAFAERILPHASDLWVQAPLGYKQRLQQLSFRRAWRSTELGSIEPPRVHCSSNT